jgi:hypothetical protein
MPKGTVIKLNQALVGTQSLAVSFWRGKKEINISQTWLYTDFQNAIAFTDAGEARIVVKRLTKDAKAALCYLRPEGAVFA